MRRGIVILLLFMLQIFPVMANDQDEERPVYTPGSEEVGSTVYGSLSGKAFEEQPDPEPSPDPIPDPEQKPDPIPNPTPDPIPNPPGQGTSSTTGSDTGDQSTFFLWIILFAGSYYILRKCKSNQE